MPKMLCCGIALCAGGPGKQISAVHTFVDGMASYAEDMATRIPRKCWE